MADQAMEVSRRAERISALHHSITFNSSETSQIQGQVPELIRQEAEPRRRFKVPATERCVIL